MHRRKEDRNASQATHQLVIEDEQSEDMPFRWSPPKEDILPPVQPSPDAARWLSPAQRSRSVSPARPFLQPVHAQLDPHPSFGPLRKALYAMLKSERDVTASDHEDATAQAVALRSVVTQLGHAMDDRAIARFRLSPGAGSVTSQRDAECKSYLDRLREVREVLTSQTGPLDESHEGLVYALRDLDAELSILDFNCRDMKPVDVDRFFGDDGPLRLAASKFGFKRLVDLPEVETLRCAVVDILSGVEDILDEHHLTDLDGSIHDESAIVAEAITTADRILCVLRLRVVHIRDALKRIDVPKSCGSKTDAIRPIQIRCVAVDNAIKGVLTCLRELEPRALMHRDLLECIRPLRPGTGRANTGATGTGNIASRAGGKIDGEDSNSSSERSYVMHKAEKFANELRARLNKLIASAEARRKGGAPPAGVLSPVSPSGSGAITIPLASASHRTCEPTSSQQSSPGIPVPIKHILTSPVNEPDMRIIGRTLQAFKRLEVGVDRGTVENAVVFEDDVPLSDLEVDAHRLQHQIDRMLSIFERERANHRYPPTKSRKSRSAHRTPNKGT